jgi:hypothetical protein
LKEQIQVIQSKSNLYNALEDVDPRENRGEFYGFTFLLIMISLKISNLSLIF